MKPGETRNPNGRPKKGETLTDVMRKFLSEAPPGQKLTYKEMFVQKSYQLAMKGDATFGKLVWNYMEGMPKQQTDITSNGKELSGLVVTVAPDADQP